METTKIKIVPVGKVFHNDIIKIDKQKNYTYNNAYRDIRFLFHKLMIV